jgi:Tfp pilus assembly PilM family ATPase
MPPKMPPVPFKLALALQRKKPRDLVAIEFDEHEIKLAAMQVKGKREFTHIAARPSKGLMDDGTASLMQQMVAASGAFEPRVYVTVPLPLVITRNIEIPSQDPDEIKEIVNLQASRHTPYARAEIIVDMLNLGIVRERYTKVLLVIVPKEAVNRQIQLIEKAGLRLEKVVFPPETIALLAAKFAGAGADAAPLAILHMDESFTTFMVVQSGKLLFVRGIHIGARQLVDERELHMDRFQDELEKSLETYSADEVGAPPKSALLTGVLGQTTVFDDVLADSLKVPLKHSNYADAFNILPAAKSEIQSTRLVSFLNVLAPLALAERIRVDLTSEEKRLKIQLEKRAHEMLKTGVLILILFTLIFANVTTKITFQKAYLKQITTHYLPVRESAKQLEKLLAKTDLVKSYLASRGYSLETLTTLYEVTPLDIRLSEIKYDESTGKFAIKGTSSVTSSVFSYVTELDKTRIFKNVKPKYVNNRNEGGKDVADFEIESYVETAKP